MFPITLGIAVVTRHVISLSLNWRFLADGFWQGALDIRYFHLCLTPTEVVLNFLHIHCLKSIGICIGPVKKSKLIDREIGS